MGVFCDLAELPGIGEAPQNNKEDKQAFSCSDAFSLGRRPKIQPQVLWALQKGAANIKNEILFGYRITMNVRQMPHGISVAISDLSRR